MVALREVQANTPFSMLSLPRKQLEGGSWAPVRDPDTHMPSLGAEHGDSSELRGCLLHSFSPSWSWATPCTVLLTLTGPSPRALCSALHRPCPRPHCPPMSLLPGQRWEPLSSPEGHRC